jgi:hypothetical protein
MLSWGSLRGLSTMALSLRLRRDAPLAARPANVPISRESKLLSIFSHTPFVDAVSKQAYGDSDALIAVWNPRMILKEDGSPTFD